MSNYEITGENGQQPSIFEFLRRKGEANYPTDNVQVYANTLQKMNLADLQTHAMDHGIKPCPDRQKLQALLLNEFKRVVSKRNEAKVNRKVSAEELKRQAEIRRKSIERSSFLRTL